MKFFCDIAEQLRLVCCDQQASASSSGAVYFLVGQERAVIANVAGMLFFEEDDDNMAAKIFVQEEEEEEERASSVTVARRRRRDSEQDDEESTCLCISICLPALLPGRCQERRDCNLFDDEGDHTQKVDNDDHDVSTAALRNIVLALAFLSTFASSSKGVLRRANDDDDSGCRCKVVSCISPMAPSFFSISDRLAQLFSTVMLSRIAQDASSLQRNGGSLCEVVAVPQRQQQQSEKKRDADQSFGESVVFGGFDLSTEKNKKTHPVTIISPSDLARQLEEFGVSAQEALMPLPSLLLTEVAMKNLPPAVTVTCGSEGSIINYDSSNTSNNLARSLFSGRCVSELSAALVQASPSSSSLQHQHQHPRHDETRAMARAADSALKDDLAYVVRSAVNSVAASVISEFEIQRSATNTDRSRSDQRAKNAQSSDGVGTSTTTASSQVKQDFQKRASAVVDVLLKQGVATPVDSSQRGSGVDQDVDAKAKKLISSVAKKVALRCAAGDILTDLTGLIEQIQTVAQVGASLS